MDVWLVREDEPVAPSARPSKAAKCSQVYFEAD